jgi:hypothetical protein
MHQHGGAMNTEGGCQLVDRVTLCVGIDQAEDLIRAQTALNLPGRA